MIRLCVFVWRNCDPEGIDFLSSPTKIQFASLLEQRQRQYQYALVVAASLCVASLSALSLDPDAGDAPMGEEQSSENLPGPAAGVLAS